MGDAPTSNPGTPREAAANAAAPDPESAAILAKYSAGEQLTPQESGKLSWIGRKFPWLSIGKRGGTAGSAQPGASPGNAAPVAARQPAEILPAVEIDPGLCQRTAAALLNRGDAYAVAVVGREATAAGASPETIDRYVAAAGLPRDDKKLLIELAPDICNELGIDPRKFAVWTAVGVLGFHSVNLWQLVGELREQRREREREIERKEMERKAENTLNAVRNLSENATVPNSAPAPLEINKEKFLKS